MRRTLFAASLLSLTVVAGAAMAQSQNYNNMTLAQFKNTADQMQNKRYYPSQINGTCNGDIVMINASFVPYPKQNFRFTYAYGSQPQQYDVAHRNAANSGLDRRHVQSVKCGGRDFVQAVWTN